MGVEININTKMCKVKRTVGEIQSEYANMSEEKLVEIQAEAYYRALKRIEMEKKEKQVSEKRKYSKLETFLYFLSVVVCPLIANKKFKLKRAYDSLLVLIISGAFFIVGLILRFVGVICIVDSIIHFIPMDLNFTWFQMAGIGLIALMYGSIFLIAGAEFTREKNSSKIYGFSASILALVGCIISIIAIVMSRS